MNTDDTEPLSDTDADSRTDRFRDCWRDGWDDHSDGVIPRPTSQYQGIDWTTVQSAYDEGHAGRV